MPNIRKHSVFFKIQFDEYLLNSCYVSATVLSAGSRKMSPNGPDLMLEIVIFDDAC